MDKIDKSDKKTLMMIKDEAMSDVRSVTGSNYRKIMLLLGKSKVADVKYEDSALLTYHQLDETDRWKVGVIKEIIDIKAGVLEVNGFDDDEVDCILSHLCTA